MEPLPRCPECNSTLVPITQVSMNGTWHEELIGAACSWCSSFWKGEDLEELMA